MQTVIIEKVFVLIFLIVGLSHLLQPTAWVEYFTWLRSKSFGGLIVFMYTLPPGIVIIYAHNIWRVAPSVLLTLIGWMMVIKSALYAIYPRAFNSTAKKAFTERNSRIVGAVLIATSIILCVGLLAINSI